MRDADKFEQSGVGHEVGCFRRLLVFAHTPPPHHGQSVMVQQLLDGFKGKGRFIQRHPAGDVNLYHVNCRFSEAVEEIGKMRWRKSILLFKYCCTAIWYRYRFGLTGFYYVPAPGLRTAIYRDWLVMAFCRPFFHRRVFHWHSAGLADWLAGQAHPWERWLTIKMLGEPDLSLVLGESGRADAAIIRSRQTVVLPNGIPDPCPEFTREILPVRRQRVTTRCDRLSSLRAASDEGGLRSPGPFVFRLLFLSLCCRQKGLFDTVEAVASVNRKLAYSGSSLRVELNVAGGFFYDSEQREFEQRIRRPDLALAAFPIDANIGTPRIVPAVQYHGFVGGAQKKRLFLECDCFCFPTFYSAESFPLVLVEAMAYGMDVIATKWRNIPELLPTGYSGIIEPRSPEQIAAAIEHFSCSYHGELLRRRFEENYTEAIWLKKVKDALSNVGEAPQFA